MKRMKTIYGVLAILLILTCWGVQYFYLPYFMGNSINDYHITEYFPELFKVPVFVCITFALFKVKWSVPITIIYCTLACLFYECLDILFMNPINWMRIMALLVGGGVFYLLHLIIRFKCVADYTK